MRPTRRTESLDWLCHLLFAENRKINGFLRERCLKGGRANYKGADEWVSRLSAAVPEAGRWLESATECVRLYPHRRCGPLNEASAEHREQLDREP